MSRPPKAAPAAAAKPRRLQAGGAQLQQELRGVDDVDGVGGEREQHLPARRQRAGQDRDEIDGVQGDDDEADRVFPEEGRREEILAEDVALPQRPGDHDRVEHQRLDDDRERRRLIASAGARDSAAPAPRLTRKTRNCSGASTPWTSVQRRLRRGDGAARACRAPGLRLPVRSPATRGIGRPRTCRRRAAAALISPADWRQDSKCQSDWTLFLSYLSRCSRHNAISR